MPLLLCRSTGQEAGEAGEGEAETAKRDEEHHLPDGKGWPRHLPYLQLRMMWQSSGEIGW